MLLLGFGAIGRQVALQLAPEREAGTVRVWAAERDVAASRHLEALRHFANMVSRLIELEEDGPLERLKPMVLRRLIMNIARQGSTDKALKLAPNDWTTAPGLPSASPK